MNWFRKIANMNNLLYHILNIFKFQVDNYNYLSFDAKNTDVAGTFVTFIINTDFNNKYEVRLQNKGRFLNVIISSDNKVVLTKRYNVNDPYFVVNDILQTIDNDITRFDKNELV